MEKVRKRGKREGKEELKRINERKGKHVRKKEK